MRKLKLESLQVESFDTSPVAPQARGTVDAHVDPRPTPPTVSIDTYNPDRCGWTNFFDCTFGCSHFTACDGPCGDTEYDCVLLTEADCV
jgi:hypothetical protein